jgi:ComF family protein
MLMSARARLFDALWPPACPVSGVAVDQPGHISADIWLGLNFLDAPWCALCGLPFPYTAGAGVGRGMVCGPCIAKPPRFDTARAPIAYDDASRFFILGFKNGGRQDMLVQFSRWMARAAAEEIAEADLIIPVPLHWRRLISRRYNQSALLARALCRETGLPFDADILARRRATPSQAGRSVKARRRNMAAAFEIRSASQLAGKVVVLVDDVYTTGATVSACTRMLKLSGARRVHVVTLARVVRTRDPTM